MTEKLVRDLIPDIIRAGGDTPVVRQANPDELSSALRTKLDEERCEYLDAETRGGRIGELVDVLEVIDALAAEDGVTLDELLALKAVKRRERGGFTAGWLWTHNHSGVIESG